ncbi:hypothetical protein Q3Y53_01190 [Synechococcus sp. YX-04-1]|uniref:methyltransferase domain-containing protein n=1 Tax=Synechococcus sp. YX-04-1 TaxID=3062778 RepID=UPI0026E2484A|nr:methyltransferase domain-containing protein [Synechococcus sp. YX-04-1]MDO6351144.1 hypothetical protein [Synechococcus sp. YX-04-1]
MENSFIEASKEAHAIRNNYGNSSSYSNKKSFKYLLTIPEAIKAASQAQNISSLLDHGCGRGGLKECIDSAQFLSIRTYNYDPAIPEFATLPKEKFDIVTSIDVLEHIGREDIDSTLTEIKGLTDKFFFFCIDLLPASKRTSDGRNFHFLIAPADWWCQKLKEHFKIATFIEAGELPGGETYPIHLYGCASNSMKNFKAMNSFLENVLIANKRLVWKNGVSMKNYE